MSSINLLVDVTFPLRRACSTFPSIAFFSILSLRRRHRFLSKAPSNNNLPNVASSLGSWLNLVVPLSVERVWFDEKFLHLGVGDLASFIVLIFVEPVMNL
jgi:hypothetical protein